MTREAGGNLEPIDPIALLSEAEDFHDRYSTGVVSFDSVLKGGVPIGSLVLLFGEEGAGAAEFVYTSAAKLSLVRDHPDMMQFVFGDFYSHMQLPRNVTYISVSRTRMDVQREINASFNRDLAKAFQRHVLFLDFSPEYFRGTQVPPHWIHEAVAEEVVHEGPSSVLLEDRAALERRQEDTRNIFDKLVDVIETYARDGIVYVNSLTDLIINRHVDNEEIMILLKGFQRVLHKWRGVIFFVLNRGVLPEVEETQFKDCFDAVMNFEWVKSIKSSKRQRYMHFEKFREVLPVLDREDIIRFSTEVSYHSGFVVVNAERII